MQARLALVLALTSSSLALAAGCSPAAVASEDASRGNDTGPGPSDAGRDAPATDDAAHADVDAADVDASTPRDAALGCDGGAAEVCNRTDDDCDGNTDEGCTCVAGAHVVLGAPGAIAPALAQTTTGFAVGLVAFTPASVSVQRVSGTLAPSGPATVVASDDTRPPSDVDVAAAGDEIGVLFRQWPVGMIGSDHTFFAHLSHATTTVLDGPVDLGPGGLGFSIDRAGASSFLESHRTADGIGFGVLATTGAVSITGAATSAGGSAAYQAIAAGPGGAIGVAFQSGAGSADLSFQRFDAAGAAVGTEITIAGGAGTAQRPSIAADGAGWAVAWAQNEGSRIVYRLAHVSSAGTIDLAPVDLGAFVTSSSSVSIATDPSGNVGAHFVQIANGEATAHFAVFSPSGARMGPDSVIAGSTSGNATLVFDGRAARFVAVRTIVVDGPVIYDPCVAP